MHAVHFEARETYLLRDEAWRASRALLSLAARPSHTAIARFAGRYGPLLNYRTWLSEVQFDVVRQIGTQRWLTREPFDARVTEQAYQLTSLVVDAGEKSAGEATGEPDAQGSDAVLFAEWCDHRARLLARHGRHEQAGECANTADYVRWCLAGLPHDLRQADDSLFLEPVLLYVWAAEHLGTLGDQIRRYVLDHNNALDAPIHRWLGARLDQTRLNATSDPGRFSLRATTLLAYLALHTVWGAIEFVPGQKRQCIGCGKEFVPSDPRRVYHDPACEDAARKRRARAKLRAQREDLGRA